MTVAKKNTPSSSALKGPQSVGRVFSILEYLIANHDGATLSELAAFTGAPKTSLVGLLEGMVFEGCIRRDASLRYFTGSRIYKLANRIIVSHQLAEVARPFLIELSGNTGETAVLGIVDSDAEVVIYVDKVDSSSPIRYAVEVGIRRELYCTALGKVLLSGFKPERLDEYLTKTNLEKFTSNTTTSKLQLKAELSRIRKNGIAHSYGERVQDSTGIATPIFSSQGELVAGLLIAGPSHRMKKNQKSNEKHLRNASTGVSDLLRGSQL
jgi:DNA-binding IclR family transcriptional regulator